MSDFEKDGIYDSEKDGIYPVFNLNTKGRYKLDMLMTALWYSVAKQCTSGSSRLIWHNHLKSESINRIGYNGKRWSLSASNTVHLGIGERGELVSPYHPEIVKDILGPYSNHSLRDPIRNTRITINYFRKFSLYCQVVSPAINLSLENISENRQDSDIKNYFRKFLGKDAINESVWSRWDFVLDVYVRHLDRIMGIRLHDYLEESEIKEIIERAEKYCEYLLQYGPKKEPKKDLHSDVKVEEKIVTENKTPKDFVPTPRYKVNDGIYTFTLKTYASNKPYDIDVDSKDIDWLFKHYPRTGKNYTIKECCRHLDWPEEIFIKIKERLGLTKSSLPISPEKFEVEKDDDVVEGIVANRELSLLKRADKNYIKNIEEYAFKYLNLERQMKDFAKKISSNLTIRFEPVENESRGKHGKKVVYVALTDLHIGKKPFDKTVTKDTVLSLYANMIFKVSREIQELYPENDVEIVTVIGSDLVHVDTDKQTTSKGTPMTDSVFMDAAESASLAFTIINLALKKFREVSSSVHAYIVRGNHDRMLSRSIGLILAEVYQEVEGVTIHDMLPRAYYAAGDTLIAMLHGDRENPKDIHKIVARDAREIFPRDNFQHILVMKGHTHRNSISVETDYGITEIISPAPCFDDLYHVENGWKNKDKVIAFYGVDPFLGLEHVRLVPVGL